MRALVSIDDTDNIDSRGTGELASMIEKAMEERGWGKGYGVTRHQLYIHEDIPYTSHNSSMCFAADIEETYLNQLTDYATAFLSHESAEGSDPGLCIVLPDRLEKPELLINFGYKAKQAIITKQEAYELAHQLGIHLSEHGGTGLGVIGALAGTGLRMEGNDGRYRGKLKIKSESGVASVGDIRAQTRVQVVKTLDGIVLGDEEKICLGGEWVKDVMLESKSVLLVYPTDKGFSEEVRWQTCTKQQLRKY